MIYPAEHDRRAWLSLKFGWLTAETLNAAVLVYAEDDVYPQCRGFDDLARARARYFELRGRVGRDRSALPKYRESIRQLYAAHKELVTRAVGYTWPNVWDYETFGRPVRVLWAFDL